MGKEFTQKSNENALNNPQKGLRSQSLIGAKGLQEVDCDNCGKPIDFTPAKFVWNTDDNFEFCDVDCPECKATIELVAVSGTIKYEFFTN